MLNQICKFQLILLMTNHITHFVQMRAYSLTLCKSTHPDFPDWLSEFHITQWILQVGVLLMVLWGYFAATWVHSSFYHSSIIVPL